MTNKALALVVLPILVGTFVSCLALFSLSWWFEPDEASLALTKRLPGSDDVPKEIAQNRGRVKIGEFFKKFDGVASSSSVQANWPTFRGLDQRNVCSTGPRLIDRFPAGGPRKLWQIELGEGHAAPAIYGGYLYYLDYLEKESADCLRCFDLLSGKELWRRWYKVEVKRNHGRSRTIPAVDQDVVVSLGPKAHVMCLDRLNGTMLWSTDLEKDYGATIPQWYAGQCPLIDEGKVLLAPAGAKDLIVALDGKSGQKLWSSPNDKSMTMSHSSIMKMKLLGEDTYVYVARGGIVGLSMNGAIRFVTTKWSPSVVAPSPVAIDERSFFACAGYGSGSVIVSLQKNGESIDATLAQSFKPREGFSLEQQSAIYHDGLLFGVLPKDAGSRRERFACCSPNDLSNFLTLTQEKFGLGPFIFADGKFFVLADDGELFIFRFGGGKFTKLSSAKVLQGSDAWGPMALVDGYLVLRDSKEAICLDVAQERK